jgi:hypothetical protein
MERRLPCVNRNVLATVQGAALLGWDLFRQLQQQQPLRVVPAPSADYQDIMPELWGGPAGVSIAVLLEFTPKELPTAVGGLEDLKRRITGAAAATMGLDGQLDYSRRCADKRHIEQLLEQRLDKARSQRQQQQQRSKPPPEARLARALKQLEFDRGDQPQNKPHAKSSQLAGVPIFYAVVLPEEDLPVTRRLPWGLTVPKDSCEISLRVVKIDPLHGEGEVTVGYADIPCEADHFVELMLEVRLWCCAWLRRVLDRADCGQARALASELLYDCMHFKD